MSCVTTSTSSKRYLSTFSNTNLAENLSAWLMRFNPAWNLISLVMWTCDWNKERPNKGYTDNKKTNLKDKQFWKHSKKRIGNLKPIETRDFFFVCSFRKHVIKMYVIVSFWVYNSKECLLPNEFSEANLNFKLAAIHQKDLLQVLFCRLAIMHRKTLFETLLVSKQMKTKLVWNRVIYITRKLSHVKIMKPIIHCSFFSKRPLISWRNGNDIFFGSETNFNFFTFAAYITI